MVLQFPGQDDSINLTEAEETLPAGFWNMPDTFIADPEIKELYRSAYVALLKENPDRDTIETMMIERAAALYAYMRSLEASVGYSNSSNYRQLTTLWNTMAEGLRKSRTVNFDEAKVREEIATDFISIINSALKGFEPEIANTVRRRIITAMDRG